MVKYERDMQKAVSVLKMLKKNWQNDGTEDIDLVNPTTGSMFHYVSGTEIFVALPL